MRILGIGVATLDIVNEVARYPVEETETRALDHRVSRGGNAANTLVMLSGLGHDCSWGGVLADAIGSALIRSDLEGHRIGMEHAVVRPGATPTSCITLAPGGTRTIVHYRNLPEYSAEDFAGIDLALYDWVHFEGRNVPALGQMLKRTRRAGVPCSLEVEKPREGMETLFPLADLLLFSHHYANHCGFHEAAGFLRRQRERTGGTGLMSCAWGEQGAWALDGNGAMHHAPALPVTVVDSLGAGDTFNAGMIHGVLGGMAATVSLRTACELAGRKCAVRGLCLDNADG